MRKILIFILGIFLVFSCKSPEKNYDIILGDSGSPGLTTQIDTTLLETKCPDNFNLKIPTGCHLYAIWYEPNGFDCKNNPMLKPYRSLRGLMPISLENSTGYILVVSSQKNFYTIDGHSVIEDIYGTRYYDFKIITTLK